MHVESQTMSGLGRRRFLMVAAGVAVALTSGHSALAASAGDPAAEIHTLNAALLSAMKSGRSETFAARMARLEPVLDQVFDLPTVLQASIGLRWSTLSPGEQAALLDSFRRYTAANYAANFDSYDNQTFQVLPGERALSDGRVIVQTRLANLNGAEHRIDYVMRCTPAGWKAVDVLADGSISRVGVQRADFGSVLARGGASALQARLASVTASLGAVA